MKDIFITGTGIISAAGNNTGETLNALINGSSGIAPIAHLDTARKEYPAGEVSMSNEEMMALLGIPSGATITRSSLMGIIAVREAMNHAALHGKNNLRIALISGTTVGGMDMSEKYYKDFMSTNERNAYIRTHDCGASTEAIAEYFDMFSLTETISTACSSAANAIMKGAELIRHGRADIVIAGGSECLTRFHLNGFSSLMILDRQPCRPFDANRNGLNLGEGAAYLVLEARETIDARSGVTPLCKLSGYANACDAWHQTASSPNGDGARYSMTSALEQAGLSPSDIGYINAHGTGTGNNDLSEGAAIAEVFRSSIPPVSSTKAATGHATSAAGSIEAVISILALRNGFIPQNLNFTTQMPELPFAPSTEKRQAQLRHVLSNSFGFGGNDTTLIFSSLEADTDKYTDVQPAKDSPDKSLSPVYILDARQISIQKPLSEEWMEAPVLHEGRHASVIDPDYKQYLPANLSRRLGKLLKRAMLTSRQLMEATAIPCPDAILTGTGFGCVENTEIFLEAMTYEGEECLKPTCFMQSTHNTIGSMIAIDSHCHGYNTTYTNRGTSCECALADAYDRIRHGLISNALVGGYDEITPHYFNMLSRINYLGDSSGTLCGEAAVSMMLAGSAEGHSPLCRMDAIEMRFAPSLDDLDEALQSLLATASCSLSDIDAVMTGISGNEENDEVCRSVCKALFPDIHILMYKHIFGEIRTAAGLGIYAAAVCLKQGRIPDFLSVEGRKHGEVSRIIFHNHCENRSHSLILLSSC